MTVQQQSRFSGGDQESINKLLQDYLDSAIEEEGNDQPFVAPGTQAERDRMWTAWTNFCGLTQKKRVTTSVFPRSVVTSTPAGSGWTLLGSPRPQGFRRQSRHLYTTMYRTPSKNVSCWDQRSAPWSARSTQLTVSLRFGGGSSQRPISRSSVASGKGCGEGRISCLATSLSFAKQEPSSPEPPTLINAAPHVPNISFSMTAAFYTHKAAA